jgi:hypothetical protein
MNGNVWKSFARKWDGWDSRTRLIAYAWRSSSGGAVIAVLPASYSWLLAVAAVGEREGDAMYNIFYIIGVIVVVLFILGYLGLR